MTVASVATRKQYDGNDVTTDFSFPYKFNADADLVVVLTDSADVDTVQTITTHYTVAGAGNDAGGTVTMLSAPETGETLTIYRLVDVVQETDLSNQGAYFLESLEDALDYLVMVSQQQQEEIDRCVKSDIVTGETDLTADGVEEYIDDYVDTSLAAITYDINVWEETASPAQDTITVSGFTLATSLENIVVYIDGVKKRESDLTRTSDTVITLDSALTGGEEIELISGTVSSGQASLAIKARTLVHTDGSTELFDPATNNQYLKQRNNADDGFVDVIKVDANDKIAFGADFAVADVFVNNSNGNPNISDTDFDIDSNITEGGWESVGPTDSGADNIWTGLDNIPLTADWVEIRFSLMGVDGSASSVLNSNLYARKGGSSEVVGTDNNILSIVTESDGSGNARTKGMISIKVPVSAANIFDLYYSSDFTTDVIDAVVVGYGYNL